jgi:hypothetical protein
MADREIICTVLKLLSEKQARNGTVRVQVVQWGKYSPTLEKREYYTDANGEQKTGKAKGFNGEDVQLILDNAEEIKTLLQKKEN